MDGWVEGVFEMCDTCNMFDVRDMGDMLDILDVKYNEVRGGW